jgi:hypothetical protein
MPYVAGGGPQATGGSSEVLDVYHSSNVFANFVPMALWNNPSGTDAVVLNALLAIVNDPEYANETKTQEATEGETSDEYAVAKEQKKLVEAGVITQEKLNQGAGAGGSPAASDTTAGTVDSGTATPAATLNSVVDDTLLYTSSATGISYYVKTVTKVPGVVFPYDVATVAPENGFTVQEVCDNLKALVINCFDPIKVQYPNAFMTCSFRKKGSGSPTSQHPKGQACDMQFAGASKSDYFAIAQWIRDNVPYDQLLLEYKTTGTGNPWIHISFSGSGNRGQVCTFMNDKNCKGPGVQGLYDLANA